MKYSTILPAFTIMALAVAHIGSLTRYDPSLARGTCGWQNHPDEMVVALSNDTMGNGVDGNKNPKCGRLIEIVNLQTGKRAKAAIVDTCSTCNAGSIAVTEAVSQAIDPNNDGSAFSIHWSGTGLLTIGKRDEAVETTESHRFHLTGFPYLKPGCRGWKFWCPFPNNGLPVPATWTNPPGYEEVVPAAWSPPPPEEEEEVSEEEAHPARDLTHFPTTITEPKNAGRPPFPPTRMHARHLATVVSDAAEEPLPAAKQRRQWVYPDDEMCQWWLKPCDYANPPS